MRLTLITETHLKHFFTILLFSLIFGAAFSQTYPVQVNTQLLPPFTPYLADYTAPGVQKLMVQIRLNDPTLTDYTCKLRITIEGVNITIRTKPSFAAQPITIQGGGIPEIFYGEDLAEYFKPNALDFSGITRSQYEKGAQLPEGVYRFTIEVLDYHRGTLVSSPGNAMAWIILNDPPMLNLPMKNSKVQIVDPNNIPFTWTPRHTGSPNAAFTTEYIFRLVEIWPLNRNPYDAFLSQPVLYETTTNLTQIAYGPAEPALLPGRKYAWQVQAVDADGRDLFKNQGKSEVFVFQYGDALGIPDGLYLQNAGPSSLNIRWDAPSSGLDPSGYRVQYREHNNRSSETWYEVTTQDLWKTVDKLQPETEYEIQLRSELSAQFSNYSAAQVFKTLPVSSGEFSCSSDVHPPPVPSSNTPAPKLNINDVIHAGGYEVEVRKITANAGGTYTGEGVAVVPYFMGAKVHVTFKDINVNDQFWLTAGEIKTVWNVNSPFLVTVEKPVDASNAPTVSPGVAVTIASAEELVLIKGTIIATVTKDSDDNIVVYTTNGETKVLPKGKSYGIVDEAGNGYVVDKQGNIAKTTATEAQEAIDRGNRDYNIALRFEKGDGKFGFDEKKYDALTQYYQKLEDGQPIAWKAVTQGTPDPVSATLEGKSYDPKKIHFDISGAPLTPTSSVDSKFNLIVTGKAGGTQEELLAVYAPTDTSKNEVLGKLNLVSYDKVSRNVVIVPVNMEQVPSTISVGTVTDKLNKIYLQAVADWRVSMADNIKVDFDDKFDDGESGLLTNYTDDMKKVINAYGVLQDNTYYLFLINDPKSGADALGYMPRSKQAGFIFVDNHTKNGKTIDPLNTIAHELGHGAFNLQHTFKEFTALTEGSTDNIMDYTNGVGDKLYKYQWDHIHDPQRVIGLFEDDEDSESVTVNNIEQIKKFENKDGSYTFISVAGKPITIKGKISMVSFVASEDIWRLSNGNLPMGTLIKFTVDEKTYSAVKVANSNEFLGYKQDNSTSLYEDKISYLKQYQYALIGVPCFKDHNFLFKVFPTSYLIDNESQKNVLQINKGEGSQKEMYFLSEYMKGIDDAVSVFGQFDVKFTDEELFFIDQQGDGQNLCGSDALYVYNIAYLIHQKPDLKLCVPDAMTDMGFMVQNQLSREYESERSQQVAAVSTGVRKHPMVLAEESRRYSEAYKEKFKEKYLENLNSAFTQYDDILSKHSSEGLDQKSINTIIDFFTVENVRGRICLLRGIPYTIRLELIKKNQLWTLTDNKEELIADLIETIADSDVPAFVTALKENDYSLFWELYGDLHMSEYDRFIYAITMQLNASNTPDESMVAWSKVNTNISTISAATEPKPDNPTLYVKIGKDFSLEIEGNDIDVEFFHDILDKKNIEFGSEITLDDKDKWGNDEYRNYYKGDLFSYVALEFTEDFQFPNVTTGESIKKGQRVIVPAIWAYWLLEKQSSIENFAVIRIIINGGAIVLSVLTMEPGPLLAVEVLANGVDIAVAINEDKIKSSGTDTQKAFLDGWNVAYAAYGGVLIGKGIFSLNINSFKNFVQSIKTSPQKLKDFAVTMQKMVVNLGKGLQEFKGANYLRSLCLSAYLQAKLLSNSVTLGKSAELIIAQENFIVSRFVTTAGTKEVSVAKIIAQGEDVVPVITEIRWYKSEFGEVEEVLQEVDDFAYMSDKNVQANGTLEVVSVKGGQSYMRLKTILTLTEEQETFMIGLKKLYSENDALQLFNYYESKFANLKVTEYGTRALIDGRSELLALISKYSNRSDLISNPTIIDGWAMLNQYPVIRNTESSVEYAATIIENKLYANIEDVQKAINSSNNVKELLESLANAKTADEFALALKDVKTIDIAVGNLSDFTLEPANVNIGAKDFYANVVKDLEAAKLQRQDPTLTQLEKSTLSEKIGSLSAHKKMLEQGYLPLEYRLDINSAAKQGQFDCIYWNGDQANPEVLLIEAKGGDGVLTSRSLTSGQYSGMRAQQGTKAYELDIIQNMRIKAAGNSSLDVTLDKIDMAIDRGQLKYLLIRQELNLKGELGDLIIKEFSN